MALIGLVGLATDLGYAFAERRTMQNSADSGALAGTHTLSKSSTTAPLTIINSVQDAAWANKIGSVHPSITSCKYVNDADTVLADCSQLVPATATGVSVTVQETHHTFFVGVIPGGPNTITTSATAIAHVQQLATPPGDGPFLVCGVDTKTVSGPKTDILIQQPANSGIWKLNPAAVTTSTFNGPTFQIFGPQVSLCGLSNHSYKGQAVGTDNKNLTAPGWFFFGNGTAAGQVGVSVNGVNGCTPAQIINCVAFLPVAVNPPLPDEANNKMMVPMILPFYITCSSCSNGNVNALNGKIMGNYISLGNGKPGWIPGSVGPIVIRLTK